MVRTVKVTAVCGSQIYGVVVETDAGIRLQVLPNQAPRKGDSISIEQDAESGDWQIVK